MIEGKMEGVGRLWGQHIALNEPLRTAAAFANGRNPFTNPPREAY